MSLIQVFYIKFNIFGISHKKQQPFCTFATN